MKVIPSFRIRVRETKIPSGPSVYILWNSVEFQYSQRVSVYIPWNFKRAFFQPSLSLSLSLSHASLCLLYCPRSSLVLQCFSQSSLQGFVCNSCFVFGLLRSTFLLFLNIFSFLGLLRMWDLYCSGEDEEERGSRFCFLSSGLCLEL